MILTSPEHITAGQVFNVGATDENYRKLDLVELMRQHINPVKIEFVDKKEDPRDYRVSFEKIKKVLGFNISRKVIDGIHEIRLIIESGIITDFENPFYYNHRR
jgi:nucleoside-diphosphate-sugar epimerase